MRKILFVLFICSALPILSKAQKSIQAEYQICIRALDFIRAKDLDSLKGLLYLDAFKNTTEEKFVKGIDDLHDIVVGIPNPTLDMVLIMTSISQFSGQTATIYSLGFPFLPLSRGEDEKGVQLVFMFSEEIQRGKIIGWKVRDFRTTQVRKPRVDIARIQPIEKFDFKTKDIIEFRILYKKRTATENHFEVSGDSSELSKKEIKTMLDEIFALVNESKIEKHDNKEVPQLGNHHNVELDVLQFVFSNYDPQLYGMFEIVNIRSKDRQLSKEFSGYLLVRHGLYRYFISTTENAAIVNKIMELRMEILK